MGQLRIKVFLDLYLGILQLLLGQSQSILQQLVNVYGGWDVFGWAGEIQHTPQGQDHPVEFTPG